MPGSTFSPGMLFGRLRASWGSVRRNTKIAIGRAASNGHLPMQHYSATSFFGGRDRTTTSRAAYRTWLTRRGIVSFSSLIRYAVLVWTIEVETRAYLLWKRGR